MGVSAQRVPIRFIMTSWECSLNRIREGIGRILVKTSLWTTCGEPQNDTLAQCLALGHRECYRLYSPLPLGVNLRKSSSEPLDLVVDHACHPEGSWSAHHPPTSHLMPRAASFQTTWPTSPIIHQVVALFCPLPGRVVRGALDAPSQARVRAQVLVFLSKDGRKGKHLSCL